MRGDDVVPRPERPHVEIVHRVHPREVCDEPLHPGDLEVPRRGLEQDERRVAKEPHRPREQDGRDDEARDRVRGGRPPEADDERGGDGRHGAERVAEQVEPGAAQVERVALGLAVLVPVVAVVVPSS